MRTDATTIRGIVVPAAWDDQGRILGLAVVTYHEERILIVPDTLGSDLASCLRKKVRVRGILRQRGSFREMEVLSFSLDGSPVARKGLPKESGPPCSG